MARDDSGSALSELESDHEGDFDMDEQLDKEQAEQATTNEKRRRSTRQPKKQTVKSNNNQQASDTAGLPKRRAKQANGANNSKKRKRGAAQDDTDKDSDIPVVDPDASDEEGNEEQVPSDVDELEESDDDEVPEDDEDDEDFRAPTKVPAKGGRKGAATNGGKAKTGAARKNKANGETGNRQREVRTVGDPDNAGSGDDARVPATRGKDDFEIADDSNIFNAVQNPKSALEGTVEDWVEAYQADEDSKGQALADLVNFVLRTCGCNLSVDKHEAQDLDGVVDKLDEIQTDFAKVNQASYPLVAKSKTYKKFRTSLAEFIQRLVESSSQSEILYDDTFCETFQSWLVASSSSKLRAFRHTSTVITLLLVEAMCEIAVQVNEEFATLQRQKETEIKKKRTDKSRLKEMENRTKESHAKKMKLEGYFKEIFDAVFVHRYRDAESGIRMECIKALGVWMRKHPDYFLEGNYLRYIGWMLTDLSKEVRTEAVSSLASLYEMENYIGSMQHFTERFKSRLVEMAVSEADIGVRCAAIHVLRSIFHHGLLEEEQSGEVARLVYDTELKVRRAAGMFFRGLLDEEVDDKKTELKALDLRGEEGGRERMNAAQQKEKEELQMKRLQMKCFASLMVELGNQLDEKNAVPNGEREEEEEHDGAGEGTSARPAGGNKADAALWRGEGAASATQLAANLQGQQKDRITLAVESLWPEVKLVQDWQALLDYLLLDHSAAGTAAKDIGKGKKAAEGRSNDNEDDEDDVQVDGQANGHDSDNQVEETCRLEDQEETFMLSVLVASIRTTRYRASLLSVKDNDERDTILHAITRALTKALPRLLAKHQTDSTRTLILLLLPQQMNLDLYLDMRLVSSYEALWDDISKQFLSQSDVFLLERAMESMRYMVSANELSQYNGEKTAALEQSVITPLKEIASAVELQRDILDADMIKKMEGTLTRLALMAKNWDVVAMVEEREEGNASSVIDIVNEILERGQMGFKEEEKLVQRALDIVSFYFLWKIVKLPQDEPTPDSLIELRNNLAEQASEYALGRGLGNTTDGVKTAAFKTLLDLRIVARNRYMVTQDQNDLMDLDIQAQYRCAGFVQAQIERYSESMRQSLDEQDDDIVNESEEEEDQAQQGSDEEAANANKKGKGKKAAGKGVDKLTEPTKSYRPLTLAQHATEYAFHDLIASFSRAICTDVIDLHHASTVLSSYARLGPFYDECGKWLGEALRHYGVYGEDGHAVAGVVMESLKASLEFYLSSSTKSDAHFLALAKHLSNHIVVRKSFVAVERLRSADLISLHNDSITYVAKKIATLESQEKATSRNKALTMFKALTLCLAGMTGKEAATVHAHMDKVFKDNLVVPSASSKHWEAQRVYEKRLVMLMSKDNTIKAAARKQAKTATRKADTSGVEGEDDEDDAAGETSLPARRPRAKPSAKKRRGEVFKEPAAPSRRSARASHVETANYADEDSDVDMEANEAAPRTATAGAKKGRTSARLEEEDEARLPSVDRGPSDSPAPQQRSATVEGLPKRKRKRAQSPDISTSDAIPPSPAAGQPASILSEDPDLPSRDLSVASPLADVVPDVPGTPPPMQRDDDLDSLAGVPDSPPNAPASQLSQIMQDLPRAGKRRRPM